MGKLIHFPLAAVRQQSTPAALNRVEIHTLQELRFYAAHGYRVKHYPRGNRFFMVREVRRAS